MVFTMRGIIHTGSLLLLTMVVLLNVGPAAAGGPYDLEFRGADVKDVLRLLGDQEGVNILISEGVSGTVTASFRGVAYEQILESILKMNDLRAVQDGPILRVEKRGDVVARGETVQTQLFRLNYAKASDLAGTVKEILSSDAGVSVDVRTNSIMITDDDKHLVKVAALIGKLDQPAPQVMIEARIIETTTNFARELGIRWGFSRLLDGGDVEVFGTAGGNSLINLPADPIYGGVGVSFGRLSGTYDLDVELTAMEDKGMGNIVSSPRIATLNNQEANIRSGVRIPIQEVRVQEGVGTSEVDYVEALLSLTVTPQITSEGYIILRINADRSVPDWARTVDGIPAILTREAGTQVMVKDGETVVIGGLLQETETKDKSSVPLLSDIPLLGKVFQNKADVHDTEELLIFITPKVIKL
jgi:type IV pilus assembly protein PilQ